MAKKKDACFFPIGKKNDAVDMRFLSMYSPPVAHYRKTYHRT